MTFAADQRAGRAVFLSAGIATFAAAAVLLWSPGALAAAGCTTTSSSGVRTIVCDAAGTDTVDVPSGANSATVVVIGGGGGSGTSNGPESGAGGNGGKVSATLDVSDIASIGVTVGAGGAGSATPIAGGGFGGGYSLVQMGTTPGVIAGGGGGGGNGLLLSPPTGGEGGDGGSGTALATAAGGQGSDWHGIAGGGGGNVDGLGTGGSAGFQSGQAGLPWTSGGGGGGDAVLFGGGGSGYGGGGSGGYITSNFALGGSGGGAGGSFADPTLASDVVFEPLAAAPGDDTPGAGGASVSNVDGNAGKDGSITITFVIPTTPSDSSQGSPSTGTTRSVSLNFTLPSAMSCDFASLESGLSSWMQLPKASDCMVTTPAGGSTPNLLGWATNARFSVDIAQRQVNNGWGAYETFNDDGDLTGVFIPAGGSTLVTNDTNLYPIWSQ